MSGTTHDEELNEVEALLAAARQGSHSSLGRALEFARQYLLLIANQELSEELRPKVGASDLVQESFIEAQRDFQQFHGTTADEWVAWLRRILLNNLEDHGRKYQQRAKRQVSREIALDGLTGGDLKFNLVAEDDPPSGKMRRQESAAVLQQAIERLSERYQQVLRLRYWEGRSLEEISQVMGRSADAVRKLWFRAIRELTREMETSDDSRGARRAGRTSGTVVSH